MPEKQRKNLEIPEVGKKIHKDFKIENARFRQNRPWNRGQKENAAPTIKVGFSFDDPGLLDNCPFVTKISYDKRGDFKYFGVAYGIASDKEDLTQWAKQFSEAKLFTMDGQFIKKI